jgi:hypothetical protein
MRKSRGCYPNGSGLVLIISLRCKQTRNVELFSSFTSKAEVHVLFLTSSFLKSIFVRTVRWCNSCKGLALLPRGAFGVSSEPCISFRSAYSWNTNTSTSTFWYAVNRIVLPVICVKIVHALGADLFTDHIVASSANSEKIFSKISVLFQWVNFTKTWNFIFPHFIAYRIKV